MMNEDDNAFVSRALNGDPRAFEVLVGRYHRVLFGVAYRMVSDREDAEDITQTAFMKAYQKLGAFDPAYKFFSWIYRILMNEALNVLQRRREQVALDADLVSERRNPEEEFAVREQEQRVQRALMQLPEGHRQVLVLRHFGSLSYREIGDVLGVPEQTVKSRLFAARQELSVILLHRSHAT
jgi:RNA polymerase sigma-70 factor, ECF subfamily